MKINFKSILKFFVLVMAFTACKNDPNVLEKGSGPAVKPGDWVFFTLTILGDTDTLQVNNNESMLPTVQIPVDPKDLKDNVMKAIAARSLGDSFLVSVPVDSFPPGNPALAGKKMIHYHFRIKNVMDSVAYKSYIDKKMQEMQALSTKRTSVDIKPIEDMVAKMIADFKANKLEVKTTSSGLKYHINEQGTGATPKAGQTVVVDYYGSLMDGKNFDKSFGRPTPFQFAVGKGNVIEGWDEAFQLLPVGTKATLFLPSKIAYKEAGSPGGIPPNSDLVFYVELNEVQ